MEKMKPKQVIEMIEWLKKVWNGHDNLKPIEYYTFTANTEHSKFSTSFSPESKERVSQALDHAINCVGAIEQIKWERDIAIQQLNELGYQFGEKIWREFDLDNEIIKSGVENLEQELGESDRE